MSLMRRVRDISIATLNDKLERAEDPVRLIDSYLADQREQVMQAEKLHQQYVSHAASLRQQYLSAEQLKEKREQQALIALKAGEEHMARMALQEKVIQEEKSEQYKMLYEQGQQAIIELEGQLQQYKADYQEVYSKRQFYVARLESVRLQQQMNERMAGKGPDVGANMFRRLEERISDLELEAKALRDVRSVGQEVFHQVGTTVQQTLEKELQKLKKKAEQEGWLR